MLSVALGINPDLLIPHRQVGYMIPGVGVFNVAVVQIVQIGENVNRGIHAVGGPEQLLLIGGRNIIKPGGSGDGENDRLVKPEGRKGVSLRRSLKSPR